METRSIKWVYSRLVCEFDHWDICLSGLVKDDGVYKYVSLITGTTDEGGRYDVYPIEWDASCDEYLLDYRKAYEHWFYDEDGRLPSYDGRDLSWFSKKYSHVNPISKRIKQTRDE